MKLLNKLFKALSSKLKTPSPKIPGTWEERLITANEMANRYELARRMFTLDSQKFDQFMKREERKAYAKLRKQRVAKGQGTKRDIAVEKAIKNADRILAKYGKKK